MIFTQGQVYAFPLPPTNPEAIPGMTSAKGYL
jgi:hypothetical protein